MTERISDLAVEELAFGWTGRRVAYADLPPLFVARIRGIVEPALHLLQRTPESATAQPARLSGDHTGA